MKRQNTVRAILEYKDVNFHNCQLCQNLFYSILMNKPLADETKSQPTDIDRSMGWFLTCPTVFS
jgi:hypothetical protein